MPARSHSAMRLSSGSVPILRPCSMPRLDSQSGSLSLWLLWLQGSLGPCWEFLACASVMISWPLPPWELILLWKPFFFIFPFSVEQWGLMLYVLKSWLLFWAVPLLGLLGDFTLIS